MYIVDVVAKNNIGNLFPFLFFSSLSLSLFFFFFFFFFLPVSDLAVISFSPMYKFPSNKMARLMTYYFQMILFVSAILFGLLALADVDSTTRGEERALY